MALHRCFTVKKQVLNVGWTWLRPSFKLKGCTWGIRDEKGGLADQWERHICSESHSIDKIADAELRSGRSEDLFLTIGEKLAKRQPVGKHKIDSLFQSSSSEDQAKQALDFAKQERIICNRIGQYNLYDQRSATLFHEMCNRCGATDTLLEAVIDRHVIGLPLSWKRLHKMVFNIAHKRKSKEDLLALYESCIVAPYEQMGTFPVENEVKNIAQTILKTLVYIGHPEEAERMIDEMILNRIPISEEMLRSAIPAKEVPADSGENVEDEKADQ